jgi:polysaccharide pyruvyl transferase WcaK-like protein
MRFVVFGGWFGSGNLGDDSILIGLRRVLNQVMPDVEIVAVSSYPAQTRQVCGVEAVSLLSPLGLLRRDGASLEAYIEAFGGADACIVSGGTPVYDHGHVSRLLHFGFPGVIGRRLFCFGIGVKPISSGVGVFLTRALVNRTNLVSTRDYPSRDELVRIGVERQVVVTGDSALFLSPAGRSVGSRKLSECGVEASGGVVAVCPRVLSPDHRSHYHEPVSREAIDGIRRALAMVADALMEDGFEVVFLPMHRVAPDDDLEEIRKIIDLMHSRTAVVVDVEMTPGEAMAVLGCMDLVLGLRLHSLILAATQGVPVVGVDYDRKIRGFMELAGAGDYLWRPSEPPQSLAERVRMGLDDSGSLGEGLRHSCDGMKERILGEAVRLASLLR